MTVEQNVLQQHSQKVCEVHTLMSNSQKLASDSYLPCARICKGKLASQLAIHHAITECDFFPKQNCRRYVSCVSYQ